MSTTDGGSITLETAFSLGTLVVNKSGAVACMCAPGTHYKPGWGPRASELRAPKPGKFTKIGRAAHAQRGKRKLGLPSKYEEGTIGREAGDAAGSRGALGAELGAEREKSA